MVVVEEVKWTCRTDDVSILRILWTVQLIMRRAKCIVQSYLQHVRTGSASMTLPAPWGRHGPMIMLERKAKKRGLETRFFQ